MATNFERFDVTQKAFRIFIVGYLLYASFMILRSSFVIDSVRYFVLSDDQMIAMTYARNFANGDGLVWNVGGEKIEGYTNPLWVVYMSLWHLLPIPPEKMSLAIQLTCMGLTVVGLVLIKKIVEAVLPNSTLAVWIALFFTAFYFPLNNWGPVLGNEVTALWVLLLWTIWLSMKAYGDNKFDPSIFIWLGLGTLVRMDFLIPAMVVTAFWLITHTRQRFQVMTVGIPIILLFILGQTFFRSWYYHDFLANTYYLKLTGYPLLLRISRGLYVSFTSFNFLVMLMPLVYLYFRRQQWIVLLVGLWWGQLLYNSFVGGDAWEYLGGANRYLAVAMPALFIALGVAIDEGRSWLATHAKTQSEQTRIARVSWGVSLALFLIFSTATRNMPLHALLLKAPPNTAENKNQTLLALDLAPYSTPQTRIGVIWAGIIPYFNRAHYVDLMGKSDRHIARVPMIVSIPNLSKFQTLTYFWPGHMKWDYDYVLKYTPPDIFAQMYPAEEKEKVLQAGYTKVKSEHGYEFLIRE